MRRTRRLVGDRGDSEPLHLQMGVSPVAPVPTEAPAPGRGVASPRRLHEHLHAPDKTAVSGFPLMTSACHLSGSRRVLAFRARARSISEVCLRVRKCLSLVTS